MTTATEHTTRWSLIWYLYLNTYSIDPAHEMYQFPPWGWPLVGWNKQECNSVNKVVLTYITALVGFLCKILSSYFNYWKNLCSYTWGYSYSESQLIYKRPLNSFPICAYITTYDRRLILCYYLTSSYKWLLMAISVPHNYGLLPSLDGGRKMIYTHTGTNCKLFSNVSFFVLTLWRVTESEFTLKNWKVVHL